MTVTITARGIREFKQYVEALPSIATTSARIALNLVAPRALKKSIPFTMREQVAFPAGYIEDPKRLSIDRPATNDELTTSIVGRERPTSLARFAEGLAAFGTRQTQEVYVTVRPGRREKVPKVFAVRLNAGVDNVDNYNVGLAMRLKPGTVIAGRRQGNDVPEIFPNVFLLYGPSVGQVFDDVAEELLDPLADEIESEFLRQFTGRAEGNF